MFWWNDLWLKESFADYSASVCLEECEYFRFVKNPRLTVQHYQTEALLDDMRSTTHPISVTVNHTNDAVNVFDKICYRKGACFLKQIDYFIGRDIMKEGIKLYFERYRFKNTQL
jgi:aminopeptidase N